MTTDNTGRRPLILNEETQKAVIDALLGGNYLETAAQYAGISRATLFEWLRKGREAQAAIEKGEPLPPNGALYADFLDAVEGAQARAEVQTVAIIRKASLESWQAAAWWLERTRPRKYGRLDRAEITGAEGSALKVDLNTERAEAAALIAEIAARRTNESESA